MLADGNIPCVSGDQSLCCEASHHDVQYPYCDSNLTPAHVNVQNIYLNTAHNILFNTICKDTKTTNQKSMQVARKYTMVNHRSN